MDSNLMAEPRQRHASSLPPSTTVPHMRRRAYLLRPRPRLRSPQLPLLLPLLCDRHNRLRIQARQTGANSHTAVRIDDDALVAVREVVATEVVADVGAHWAGTS